METFKYSEESEELTQPNESVESSEVKAPDFRPINPQWEELKRSEEKVIQELKESLGEDGDWPFDIELDENGELKKVLVNGINMGAGKLGKVPGLKEQATNYFKEQKEQNSVRDDSYLMEAYKTNPEVKRILDEGVAKAQELNKIRGEYRQQIITEKAEQYKSSEGLNELLGKLGLTEKLPSYDLNSSLEKIQNASVEELILAVKTSGGQIAEILRPFDELVLSQEQKEDLTPDRLALERIIKEFTDAIIRRDVQEKQNSGTDLKLLEAFHEELSKSQSGKRYLYNNTLSADRLF